VEIKTPPQGVKVALLKLGKIEIIGFIKQASFFLLIWCC